MGSCVSVHKDSESAMKIRLVFGSSKTDKLVTPSPLNKNDTKVSDLQLKSQTPAVTTFPDFGTTLLLSLYSFVILQQKLCDNSVILFGNVEKRGKLLSF